MLVVGRSIFSLTSFPDLHSMTKNPAKELAFTSTESFISLSVTARSCLPMNSKILSVVVTTSPLWAVSPLVTVDSVLLATGGFFIDSDTHPQK